MYHDLGDLESLIWIQITPKKRTLNKVPATLKHKILNLPQVDTSPVDPFSAPSYDVRLQEVPVCNIKPG